MFLTPLQINELLEVIDVHFLKFTAQNISDTHLTKAEKAILKKHGVSYSTVTPTIDNAYKFGMLSQALGTSRAKAMTFSQLKKYLAGKQFLPLDFRETEALKSLKHQAFYEIKGLGEKIRKDFSTIMNQTDKSQRVEYESVIRDASKKAIVDRQSISQMASEIGHKTGDWARDLDRIADYIMHDAHDNGRAMQIRKMGGEKARVYKHVFDQACKQCVRIYLTNGIGSEPETFTVDELRRNGTNIGRKAQDWKAVIGATHPWCRCQIESVPEGSVWDDKKGAYKIQLTDAEEDVRKLLSFKMK